MKINDQDGWNTISEVGVPEKGMYYDCYTFDENGGRIVKKLYLSTGEVAAWLSQPGGWQWNADVTHWRRGIPTATSPTATDDQIIEFNEYCAKIMGIEVYKDSSYICKSRRIRRCSSQTYYDPWCDYSEMEKVLKVLLSHSEMDYLTGVIGLNGNTNVYRSCIHNLMNGNGALYGMPVAESEAVVIPLENVKIDKTVDESEAVVIPLENVKIDKTVGEREFNKQCYNILIKHGKQIDFIERWSPFDNLSQLSLIMDIVLEKSGQVFSVFICDDEEDVSFTEEQRQYIITYGTDEYLRDEEWNFNELCSALFAIAYNAPAPFGDYDPYNNIEDLAPVLPVVIRWSEEPFSIPGNMEVLCIPECRNHDIHDNMRFYVRRFGQQVLDTLKR